MRLAAAVARRQCPVWLCQTGRYTTQCDGWRDDMGGCASVPSYVTSGEASLALHKRQQAAALPEKAVRLGVGKLLFAAVGAEAAYFCAGDGDFYGAVAGDLTF